MDRGRFGEFAQFLSSPSSRRAAIVGVGHNLIAVAPVLRPDNVAFARRKRCKRPRKPTPQPTCDEVCGSDWIYCFNPPNNGPLCGNFWRMLCTECASDNDCVGSPQPYCVVDRIVLESGERERWNCAEYAVGICATIERV